MELQGKHEDSEKLHDTLRKERDKLARHAEEVLQKSNKEEETAQRNLEMIVNEFAE